MDSTNNIRITSFKKNNIDWFRDFYISILIDREIEVSKKEFKQNRVDQFLEPGYIYVPYIPIIHDDVPTTGVDISGLMSRYTNITIDRNLYETI